MSVLDLTTENFEEEIKSCKTMMVDFWASWCGPCRMLSPVIDQIAEEKSETLSVGKVNVDEEPDLAAKFGVMSIPTVVVFRDGKEISRSVGVRPKEDLIEMLDEK